MARDFRTATLLPNKVVTPHENLGRASEHVSIEYDRKVGRVIRDPPMLMEGLTNSNKHTLIRPICKRDGPV